MFYPKFPMCTVWFGYRITTILVHIASGHFSVFAFDQISFLFVILIQVLSYELS